MSSWARLLRPASVLVLILACSAVIPATANAQISRRRLDKTLSDRARIGVGESRVIVTFKAGWDASEDAKRLGAKLGRRMRNGSRVMQVSNAQLEKLANHPAVEKVRWDRPIFGLPVTESASQKAPKSLAESLGYTGRGVGVAIIDSGITPWHDELTYSGSSPRVLTKGGQRIAAFVDYTQEDQVLEDVPPYDDYGHGTHVAGIIAGNGLGSNGLRKGSAPEAHLVVLKVLDRVGRGNISDVADAVDYAREHKDDFNIRVINLSIAAKPSNPEDEDLLAEATKAAVEAGIVVVAAAGNLGSDKDTHEPQYGGITAPGVYPWVLTVGAYDQNGTASPRDDVIALFSSRGPTAYTFLAKPDLVAPGTAIVSLFDPTSELYARKAGDGSLVGGEYISLSGTSVAAPAVSGTVALMVQAYPSLTPNLAKAVLQYTATFDPDYDRLTQGAGYLNPNAAVTLSQYFARARTGDRYPLGRTWGRKIIWGNYLIGGGVLWPNASAWATDMVWGATVDEEGDNIVWGTLCAPEDCDNIVWGTAEDLDNIVWGTDEDGDNIVWGTQCRDGADENEDCDNIVWGTTEDTDNIVWGTCTGEDCDNIVWGTCVGEDCDNIVWGTECGGEDCDNIVWGTACGDADHDGNEDCDNIVWGTAEDDDNIVWETICLPGTICAPTPAQWEGVWSTVFDDMLEVSGTECTGEDCDNIVWGTSAVTTAPVPAAPPWTARKKQPRGSSRR